MEFGISISYYLLWMIGLYFLFGNINLIVLYSHSLKRNITTLWENVRRAMVRHAVKSFGTQLAVITPTGMIVGEKREDILLLSEPDLPFVTIIIPVYDEAGVIGETIERFMNVDYPKDRYELLIATYESDLSTRTVIEDYMKKYRNIRVAINREKPPTTKAQNVNNAYSYLTDRTEIVGLHDAEDRVSKNILKNITATIAKEKCIQSKVVVELDENSTLTEKASSINFARCYNLIVPGKNHMGYLIFSAGVGTYIKRDILDKIITSDGYLLDEKNLVEDFELSLRLARHGYKIRYDPRSEVQEKFPKRFDFAVKQRTRWALGGMQTLRKHGLPKEFTFKEKLGIVIDLFGLGSPLWLFALLLLIFCIIGSLIGFKIIPEGSILWHISILNTVLGIEELIVSPYFVVKEKKIRIKTYFGLIPAVILNDIINVIAVSRAIYKYISASQKNFTWDKTQHE